MRIDLGLKSHWNSRHERSYDEISKDMTCVLERPGAVAGGYLSDCSGHGIGQRRNMSISHSYLIAPRQKHTPESIPTLLTGRDKKNRHSSISRRSRRSRHHLLRARSRSQSNNKRDNDNTNHHHRNFVRPAESLPHQEHHRNREESARHQAKRRSGTVSPFRASPCLLFC
jgi:hypothetical protein